MKRPTIIGMGGVPSAALFDYAMGFADGRHLLVDTTASARHELDWPAEWDAEPTHLSFYPWPPGDLRELALSHDAILVGGGNTANMIAVWRVHEFDEVLREAWESGIVLFGWSAGMICWFEAGITDSFGPQLAGMRDGLGFLDGSGCPHYDGDEKRRPTFQGLVADGFPPGLALDDAAAARFDGTDLVEVVSDAPSASGYRVEHAGETRLATRVLS